MRAGSGPTTPRKGTRRGLLWALLIAVVVLAASAAACSGEEAVTVPDLVGLEETEARDALSDADLAIGDVERLAVENDATEIGTVLSQAPSPGSEVDSGSQVSLVVASEPEEASEEDGNETPPAGSGSESGSGGGAGAEPEPAAEPEPEPGPAEAHAAPRWWRVVSHSGSGNYTSPAVSTTSARLQLAVNVTSISGNGFVFGVGSGELDSSHWRDCPGTPAEAAYTWEIPVPSGAVGKAHRVAVFCRSNDEWSYELREWR